MRTYLPDFIVRVDDGRGSGDLLHLVVEIKGYRREDAKEKKTTMDTHWIPGVNHNGQYGRWGFAEFTDAYRIEADFKNRVESEFNKMIESAAAQPRGQVQCIYIDPPYGIKFNSNFQWSTTSRDVKDTVEHITREPEQVKAFRDTWREGIHSYLTYLRDRLTLVRDLLAESGSIFVQIGDENFHRIRTLMDEVFGETNLISAISFKKTSGTGSRYLENIYDYVLWYAKNANTVKYRQLFTPRSDYLLETQYSSIDEARKREGRADPRFLPGDMSSQGASDAGTYPYTFNGQVFRLPPNTHWKPSRAGMPRLARAGRLVGIGQRLRYRRFADDFPFVTFNNSWEDTIISGYSDPKTYVVQTAAKVIQRCILMTTDPGDLVLDPTCGSGTTAYFAEQWGRRWITIDTSRVALALARARLMGSRYPYYLLADSKDGQQKEAEVTKSIRSEAPTHGDIRQGLVYERVPHITLKSIANNAEIDVIWEKFQEKLEPVREQLNTALKQKWQEWEIPREAEDTWSAQAKKLHAEWWLQRIARQKEIDASIAAKADFEYLLRQTLRRQAQGACRGAVNGRKPVAAPRAGRGRE
jgi:adenine-specific DNA-methyltransferase